MIKWWTLWEILTGATLLNEPSYSSYVKIIYRGNEIVIPIPEEAKIIVKG